MTRGLRLKIRWRHPKPFPTMLRRLLSGVGRLPKPLMPHLRLGITLLIMVLPGRAVETIEGRGTRKVLIQATMLITPTTPASRCHHLKTTTVNIVVTTGIQDMACILRPITTLNIHTKTTESGTFEAESHRPITCPHPIISRPRPTITP